MAEGHYAPAWRATAPVLAPPPSVSARAAHWLAPPALAIPEGQPQLQHLAPEAALRAEHLVQGMLVIMIEQRA